MAKLMKDKAEQPIIVSVRTVAAFGGQRYRAGLGPFGPTPVVVQATPEQAAALKADPTLIVEVIK